MAASRLANVLEKAIGHDTGAAARQDASSHSDRVGNRETMKVLCWMGKNDVQIRNVQRPRILEPTDVIIKVTGSSVCGSDLHLLHGAMLQMQEGDILGHEFIGIADEIGPEVKKIKPGKRYVASFQSACGECYYCKRKPSTACEKTTSDQTRKILCGNQASGFTENSHLTGRSRGGQAEYVRISLGDVKLLEIPDSVPDEKALYLNDVLPTAYNAARDTGVFPDGQTAVFSCGAVGHMAATFSLKAGASLVILLDAEPRFSFVKSRWSAQHARKLKLKLVDFKLLSFGITTRAAAISELKELCGGRGPDCAIECAASEYSKGWLHRLQLVIGLESDTGETIYVLVESVRCFGRCGITAVYVGYANQVNLDALMEKGMHLIGNGQTSVHKYWRDLLDMIEKGDLGPLQMVSHRVTLEDLDSVYHAF
ncbi:chaperonin 10-like protein [Microdochium bolleyi]|uniref:Chaperonin 10-like protein n=1 Tax=Microdochium bolleyi TaxID=196109 RepID=A0A136IME1_9PEZI|nr:chaperonin 10-like protein [Microdochium bolleyi]